MGDQPRERPVWVARLPVSEVPAPLVLPAGWWERPCSVYGARGWASRGGLLVMMTADVMSDDGRWLHLSASRASHVPTYADLCEVKALFFGPEREALHKFAKRSEHVNDHPYVIHLWSRLDADATPDFRVREVDGRASL